MCLEPAQGATLGPCQMPFGHDGDHSPDPAKPLPPRPHLRGIEIQSAPWHYRWDGAHHPKRCLLCFVERWAIRLKLAHYEPDYGE
jgi:hypothetical protein